MKVGLEMVVSELPENIVKAKDWAYLKPVIPAKAEILRRHIILQVEPILPDT